MNQYLGEFSVCVSTIYCKFWKDLRKKIESTKSADYSSIWEPYKLPIPTHTKWNEEMKTRIKAKFSKILPTLYELPFIAILCRFEFYVSHFSINVRHRKPFTNSLTVFMSVFPRIYDNNVLLCHFFSVSAVILRSRNSAFLWSGSTNTFRYSIWRINEMNACK